ncbi:MAG: aldose epimerase family protein [Microthrixaceae bacterium]
MTSPGRATPGAGDRGAGAGAGADAGATVDRRPLASVEGARGAELVTLRVGALRAEVLTYGAHLVGLRTPDRNGRVDDIVSSLRDAEGRPDLARYTDPVANPHLGSIVGRVANRIGGARVSLDGRQVQLVANEGPHQLHGGPVGIDRHVWSVRGASVGSSPGEEVARVRLAHVSPDGDQGYPGRLELVATYTLRRDGLRLEVEARTDRPTIVGLTHHGYWNLGGAGDPLGAVDRLACHRLRVAADRVVVVDADLIPTGELRSVAGTPFDLREGVEVSRLLGGAAFEATGGIDHCLVVGSPAGGPVEGGADGEPVAVLVDPISGRRLELRTDQVGLQVYAANHGAGDLPRHGALCWEPQAWPDAPNQPGFPDLTLHPGAVRTWTMDLRVGVE